MIVKQPLDFERYGPPRLSVELTDICNLHCSYCLRDDEALYRKTPNYFPLELFKRIIHEAREAVGISGITFTGGEPSLHPGFADILAAAESESLRISFVTNGWNFEKIWPSLQRVQPAISHVAFSIDGVTGVEHDKWRGSGSFVRLVKAFARCYKAQLPFAIKVGIRRDTVDQFEKIAMFAARVGAATLSFGHILPTSPGVNEQSALSREERRQAEEEIASLARIFRMNIGIDVGYYNINTEPPCSPLAGRSYNIDYLGRLTLCCNLSGFRGADRQLDIAADLNTETFHSAHARLQQIAELQLKRRREAIDAALAAGLESDLNTGSPCLFCLNTFGKTPWHTETQHENTKPRSLPVVNTSTAIN